jgi:hypothetical protein
VLDRKLALVAQAELVAEAMVKVGPEPLQLLVPQIPVVVVVVAAEIMQVQLEVRAL